MAYRNIRYRLYPKSRSKAGLLCRCMGATRYVWNHFLNLNNTMMEAWRKDDSNPKPEVSFFSLGKEFTKLRQGTDWLLELPANPIKYMLKYQADSWKQCFRSGAGFPNFKARHFSDQSVTFTEGTFSLKGEFLHLQRIGQVVLGRSNPYEGCEARQGVVRKERGKCCETVSYEVPDDRIEKTENGEWPGLDMNAGRFAGSDGVIRHLPDMERLDARKRRYRRRMARQQKPNRKQGIKPSNRYLKTRKRIQRVSRQIRNLRNDWQHRESRKIADRYQYAVVEDPNAPGMTRSARGSAENPGKNVKTRSGLNREILKTGWSGLRQRLSYKMEVVEVDPKNTSRTCHECGHVDRKNRKTQSRFGCVSCRHSGNADINAALNMLAPGTRAAGQGGRSGYGPGELSRRYGDVGIVNYSL